jgi:hypothetical protein
LLCSEVQSREAMPVSQGDVVTRSKAVADARDVALKCPVVEFLAPLAVHAASLSDLTTAHRHEHSERGMGERQR